MRRSRRETSGASGFGCERTVSPGTASSKRLQKVLRWGCLRGAELSVMKFPEGEILAMPWVHQQIIHTPAFCLSLLLGFLLVYSECSHNLRLVNTKIQMAFMRSEGHLHPARERSPHKSLINSALNAMG